MSYSYENGFSNCKPVHVVYILSILPIFYLSEHMINLNCLLWVFIGNYLLDFDW